MKPREMMLGIVAASLLAGLPIALNWVLDPDNGVSSAMAATAPDVSPPPAPSPAPAATPVVAPGAGLAQASRGGFGMELKGRAEYLAEFHPERLLETLNGLANQSERDRFITAFFNKIALLSRTTALEAANRLPAGPDRELALLTLAGRWHGDKPSGAQAQADMIKQHGLEVGLGHYLLQSGADAETVAQWSLQLGQGVDANQRWNLLGAAARELAKSDAAKAFGLGSQITDPAALQAFQNQVAAGWAQVAPEAAWEWAKGLPVGEPRDQALTTVAGEWAAIDSANAIARIADVSDPNSRGKVLETVGWRFGARDTEGALAWLNQIADPNERAIAERGIQREAPIGIGALINDEQGQLTIRALVQGPAREANALREGDRILAVGGAETELIEVRNKPLHEVVSMIRGERGSVVYLEVSDPAERPPKDRRIVSIVRDQVIRKPGDLDPNRGNDSDSEEKVKN